MFTQNYIDGVKGLFKGESFKFVPCGGGSAIEGSYERSEIGKIGYHMRVATCREYVTSGQSSVYAVSTGVYFGKGTTPATKDDYKLESPITSGLTITNPSYFVEVHGGDGKYIWVSDFVVQNTSGAEVNISEIGLHLPFYYSGNSTYYLTLAERTVLDEPIVIPAGATRVIEYKITFNQL